MSSLIHQIRLTRSLNLNARLFLVHSLVFGLGLSIIILLFNLYLLSLGFHQDTIGLVTLVAAFTTVVASIPAGILMRTLGWQRALFVAIPGTAASIVISLLSPTLTGFILTELVWGFFFALLVLIGGPFMSENSTNEQRDALFTIQFAITMLSFVVGNITGGRLTRALADLLGVAKESPQAYAAALWISVALIMASALPFFFLHKPHTHETRERVVTLSSFGSIRHSRPVLKLALIQLVGGAAGGFFLPFVNVFWKLSFNLGDARIGELFALSALLIAFVTLLAPLMTARWGRIRVIILAQFASIPATLAFGLSNLYAIALVGYFLRDAVYHMARPLLLAFQMEQVEADERAALVAVLSIVWNLAWGAASWLSGQWQVERNLGLVFVTTALFQFASTALLYYFFGRMSASAMPVVN